MNDISVTVTNSPAIAIAITRQNKSEVDATSDSTITSEVYAELPLHIRVTAITPDDASVEVIMEDNQVTVSSVEEPIEVSVSIQ